MKKLILLGAALTLAGCATASKPGAMLAPVTEKTIITETSKLHNAVNVGEVTGGKETNPLWTSEVSSEDFAEALRQSFVAHAMLSDSTGQYRLDAELTKLKQPFAGFDMTVTSTVDYTLTEISSGNVIYQDTVITPYTAKMSDAFVGTERLRLANEGAIKGNISSLIEALIAKVDAVPGMAFLSAAKQSGS